MARKLSDKQIRIFGTKAQKAALKRRRSGKTSRSRAPRARPKVHHMPRNRSKKGKSGRKAKASWTDMAVRANVVLQAAEPFVPAALAAAGGDVPGAISAARPALKEAGSLRNIAQMAIPFAGRALIKKAASAVGARSPKVFGRKLF